MDERIGFIGFGEAGSAIAAGLAGAGARVRAFDAALAEPAGRARLARRAAEAGVELVESLAALARASSVVVSTVVSSAAREVAAAAARHLGPGHVYLDLNSTSPALKREMAALVEAAGARFVEGAVMTAVPPRGHRVPILLGGPAAPELIARLRPLGMVLEDLGPEVGRAAAVKMFRSIVVKGLEALLLECVLAASRYGVAERVLASVGEGYPGLDWNRLAHYLLGRTAVHGARRAHEMEEVARTLAEMGIEPIMAEAAARRIGACATPALKARFADRAPESYHEVVAAIRESATAPARRPARRPAQRR